MPRKARTMSESRYMHVITRGIGRQLLFEEEWDYKYYLKRLEQYCLETKVKVCAYCLMENHVHLLLFGESSSITLLMKKIGVSYSWYFNKKYDRVGHLFQDRYFSEPIENTAYLLAAFRYILQNPQRAGVCPADDYKWSSYRYYDSVPEYMDTSVVMGYFGSRTAYEEYIKMDAENQHVDNMIKHDDEWAKREMETCLGGISGMALKSFERKERDAALRALKEQGISVRQIERLTGIGRNIIQRA